MTRKAAEGIRVADFSWVVAGPVATKYLGVMGAEVIKVESLKRGDAPRQQPADARPFFSAINHNKKSIQLNLSTDRGKELARELIKKSDVVIENYATGVMERMGLGYEALKEIKPDIIMVSSASLGHTGPYKEHIAYGLLVSSYAGIDSITGYEDGAPRGMGAPWGDPLTGVHLTLSILAAIHHRDRTGEGQFIDMSMAEAISSQIPEAFIDYTLNQKVWGPRGNLDEGAAPHNTYKCVGDDQWVAIAVRKDAEWDGLRRAMGNPAWSNDPRFATGAGRFEHRAEIDGLVEEWTKQYTKHDARRRLQAEGVPSGASLDTRDLVEDPHLIDRNFFALLDHGKGPIQMTGMPWKISSGEHEYELVSMLGADNDYVFGDLLGLSKEEIAKLTEEQILY